MPLYREVAKELVGLLEFDFSKKFLDQTIRSPRAFRSQDLSTYDILTLSEKFCTENADRNRPILVLGLRTAGSYFAPLLHADLANRGYCDICIMTLRPKNGATQDDREKLHKFAQRNGIVVVIDEPIYQGETLAICLKMLDECKVSRSSVVIMFPLHFSKREWQKTNAFSALKGCRVITSNPEEYFKYEKLRDEVVEKQLEEYFFTHGWESVSLFNDEKVHKFNASLDEKLENSWTTHLKRVYGIRLKSQAGTVETKYIIAKSVGWGWQSYRAFFSASCLVDFIPPVLGLRDGILYSEWIQNGQINYEKLDRKQLIETISAYITARVNGLHFTVDPSPSICHSEYQAGMMLVNMNRNRTSLASVAALLNHLVLRHELSTLTSSAATLIDGKMRLGEWLQTDSGIIKTDYEQHGLGKIEVNVTDPAYDLADSILSFDLSLQEETELLRKYACISRDTGVTARMPLYKILTGIWNMSASKNCIDNAKLTSRHREFNDAYINAWTFSMIQLARYCASFVHKLKAESPSNTIVFADVDGVIDRYVFSFPSNTPSGIRALSLLHSHGFPVVLNTARSVYDVKEYCTAYGFAGGVAESGSYVLDAATGKEQILISEESQNKIKRVREALERLPGIFTNHYYRYSIKAFTYNNGTVPVTTSIIHNILIQCGAEDLLVHQTSTDTAITSNEVDKGTGLTAMLQLLGNNDYETIAIGDTEPDLAMFRVASRSYAPSHISVRNLATQLGCHVASRPLQAGFLEIARQIVHPNGGSCRLCVVPKLDYSGHNGIFMNLLAEMDKSKPRRLLNAIFNKNLLKAFKEFI